MVKGRKQQLRGLFLRDNFRMERNADLEDVTLLVEIFMKENLKMIKYRVLVNTDLVMEEYIRGTS